MLGCCTSVLSKQAYLYLALAVACPLLAGIGAGFNLSRVWFDGALLSFALFHLTDIVFEDIRAVSGTNMNLIGSGIITAIALFMFILLAIMIAPFSLGEGLEAMAAGFVLMLSLAWSFLNGLVEIPHTLEMTHYAIAYMIVVALIHQATLFSRARR